ncbi:transposase domain-containing protein [Streptomyces mirabilis]|uniref:transposase domain-containing protein n=1 Tax=Streptomyces mirabilis TaxID=68239 RepID=UPI003681914C
MAAGRFAPGHLGELTAVVPFELVDAVLAETRTVQQRLGDLPSRVGVYLDLRAVLAPVDRHPTRATRQAASAGSSAAGWFGKAVSSS